MDNKTKCIVCGEIAGTSFGGDCDCGRDITVCKFCLAGETPLACGECGIVDATDESNPYSIVLARRTVQEELELADYDIAIRWYKVIIRRNSAKIRRLKS